MKKIITILFITFFVSHYANAQYLETKLPVCVDAEWFNKSTIEYHANRFWPSENIDHSKVWSGKKQKPILQTESGIVLVNVSNEGYHQSETWISMHPNDPNILIGSCNDGVYNSGNYNMSAYYSSDGGKTWGHSLTPPGFCDDCLIEHDPSIGNTMVDPGLAFDSKGNVYYVYLFAQLLENNDQGENVIFVAGSSDNGKTWLKDWDPETDDEDIVVYNTTILQDKCFIGADFNPNSPYADRLYVTWYNTDGLGYIDFTYYDPDDGSWSFPIHLPGAEKYVQSPIPVTGPNGEVYVAWENKDFASFETKCWIHRSTDGGDTWDHNFPKLVQTVKTCGEKSGSRMVLKDKEDMRISSHPSMAVDHNTGNVYVVQAGKDENADYGIFFAKSTDRGDSWSTVDGKIANIRAIDDGELRNDRFMPSIAVDQSTGMIAVGYYSSQNSEDNKSCDYYVAVSIDEGETWSHVRVTETPIKFVSGSVVSAGSEALGRYWGDYTCISAGHGHIRPLFWMPTSSNYSYGSVDLFTALLSTQPGVPTDLVAVPNQAEPNKITINWSDPTTNLLKQNLTDFDILVYVNGTKVAEVEKGVGSFEYDQAISGNQYYFELQARESATDLKSERVGILANAGGSMLAYPPSDIHHIPNANGLMLYWTNPSKHIDSTDVQDLYEIHIYVDNDTITPAAVVSEGLVPGQESSVQLNLETEKFHTIRTISVTKRDALMDSSWLTASIPMYAGEPKTVLDENFDGEIIPYYTNTTWDVTEESAVSGTKCMTDSPNEDYKSSEKSQIIFAPVAVSDEKKTLSFNYIACIDRNEDYGFVSVSSDYGMTWNQLRSFNERSSDNFDSDIANSSWEDLHLNLEDYVGETIMVSFYIISNFGIDDSGLFIDDLKIDDHEISVEEMNKVYAGLEANVYPNPVNNNSTLEMSIPVSGHMNVEVYDALGNMIKCIMDREVQPGRENINVCVDGLSNGVYYCHIKYDGYHKVVPYIINK